VNGAAKLRPAVALKKLPPFGDILICGVRRQVHQIVQGFDEIISVGDDDFASSGLDSTSLIRRAFYP
jgi:hypothetical protein